MYNFLLFDLVFPSVAAATQTSLEPWGLRPPDPLLLVELRFSTSPPLGGCVPSSLHLGLRLQTLEGLLYLITMFHPLNSLSRVPWSLLLWHLSFISCQLVSLFPCCPVPMSPYPLPI